MASRVTSLERLLTPSNRIETPAATRDLAQAGIHAAFARDARGILAIQSLAPCQQVGRLKYGDTMGFRGGKAEGSDHQTSANEYGLRRPVLGSRYDQHNLHNILQTT